jgi:flagellar basal body-associated protein FliL
MNIKWMVLIVIVLLVALIAISLFVPKHLTEEGKISTFKAKGDVVPPVTTPTTITE